MAKNDFWDLSCRPHTQLKLKILIQQIYVISNQYNNT